MASKKVQATDTSFDIIETLVKRNGASIPELAEELDRSTSTIHGHLVTLVDRGYVIKRNGEHHVALQFLNPGTHARRQIEGYDIIVQQVDWLATETNERAQFMALENGQGIYVYVAEGQRAVPSHTHVGKIRHLNTSAAGKAILSQLPRSEVNAIIDKWGLKQRTSNTVTDREQLFDDLSDIRERGYAINREESVEGLLAIGVPICKGEDEVLGSISLSGPLHRMQGNRISEELPNNLLAAVEEFELKSSFS